MLFRGRIDCDAFLGENRCHPFGGLGALSWLVDARQRLERNGVFGAVREVAAEIVPVPPQASADAQIEPPKSKAKIWLPW